MAALGREAPAHVHGSVGAWSQPKVLPDSRAPVSLLGLLSPHHHPHWTPGVLTTSVAIVSTLLCSLPAACLLPRTRITSAMTSFTISHWHHFPPPTSSPLPAPLRLNCFPSSPPPHHTQAHPHLSVTTPPPSPAPPTITPEHGLGSNSCPAFLSPPYPQPQRYLLLTGLCAVFPAACLLPLSPPFPTVSTINEHLLSTDNPRPTQGPSPHQSPCTFSPGWPVQLLPCTWEGSWGLGGQAPSSGLGVGPLFLRAEQINK